MAKKTVLITGCSSGFGRLAAETFHEKGWNVVATMRSPEKETELTELEDVLVIRLDVTDPPSIGAAVDAALDAFGTLDVVVNNAGYGGHMLLEQASDEAIRAMFETNVFGVINVSRAALPHMRRHEGGRIINVTSMAGMLGVVSAAVYSATKHAVQGLTEAMAFEYKPLDILFKTVLPGAYPTTRFNDSTDNRDLGSGDEEITAYAQKLMAHLANVAEQMAAQGGAQSDPQEVADKIYECATADTPVHNPIGADAEMIIGMMGVPPRQEFLDKLAVIMMPPGQ